MGRGKILANIPAVDGNKLLVSRSIHFFSGVKIPKNICLSYVDSTFPVGVGSHIPVFQYRS
jgi:hypothetical protein